MASRKPTLAAVYSYDARQELRGIYTYNATKRGPSEAVKYEVFLIAGIDKLATDFDAGRAVEGFPELRRIKLKRSSQGHGAIT